MKPPEPRFFIKLGIAYLVIAFIGGMIALSSCTDNPAYIDGMATYDTIPRQQITEDMQVWETIDSSRVIVVR